MSENNSESAGMQLLEYEQVQLWLRYFMEYRAKIFGFSVILTGSLITVVSSSTIGLDLFLKCLLSLFGFFITLLFFLAELRVMQFFFCAYDRGMEIERQSSARFLLDLRENTTKTKWQKRQLHRIFSALYIGILILWVLVFINQMLCG